VCPRQTLLLLRTHPVSRAALPHRRRVASGTVTAHDTKRQMSLLSQMSLSWGTCLETGLISRRPNGCWETLDIPATAKRAGDFFG